MFKDRRSLLLALGLLTMLAVGQAPQPVQPPKPAATQAQPAANAQTAAPAATAQSSTAAAKPATKPVPEPEQLRQKDPRAPLVWSVELAKDAIDELPAESAFLGTRSLVVAGDRAVAIFESKEEISHGGRPLNSFRMISIDEKIGEIKGQKEIQQQSRPYLFSTSDDHLIVGDSSLTRLNPDLSESGEKFNETGHGRTFLISPDGGTLAHWTGDGSDLMSASTLALTGVRIRVGGKEPVPEAVGKSAVLSNDARWASAFPHDATFVTLIDAYAPHLLYHGACGGRPVFLADDKILFIGCKKITVIDSSGKLLKELPLGANYGDFAGVSRDGSRFAIATTDYTPGDPSYMPDELFTIYNSETYEIVATVAPEIFSQARSWSAFSPDGKQFLCGSPRRLALYKLP